MLHPCHCHWVERAKDRIVEDNENAESLRGDHEDASFLPSEGWETIGSYDQEKTWNMKNASTWIMKNEMELPLG